MPPWDCNALGSWKHMANVTLSSPDTLIYIQGSYFYGWEVSGAALIFCSWVIRGKLHDFLMLVDSSVTSRKFFRSLPEWPDSSLVCHSAHLLTSLLFLFSSAPAHFAHSQIKYILKFPSPSCSRETLNVGSNLLTSSLKTCIDWWKILWFDKYLGEKPFGMSR